MMNCFKIKKIILIVVLPFLTVMFWACEQNASKTDKRNLEEPTELNTTVGSIARLYDFSATPVKGFGIVANLPGTGSSECPPDLRVILEKYIQQQVPDKGTINPNSFINSKNTAVVEVYGVIPPVATKGQNIDLKVAALSSTQTTSLAGGRLFTTDLKGVARFTRFNEYSKTLAKAAGPIFIDTLETQNINKNTGYILGGGVISIDALVSLILSEPSYFTASAIHNRLNERFGPGTANAISPTEIIIKIPDKFKKRKVSFLEMVKLLYITDNSQLQQARIDSLVRRLAESEDKIASELALTAIGKGALDELAPLLDHPDQRIRLHSARCMLDIGDDRALRPLRKIIIDRNSPYRIDAIQALGTSAKRNDVLPILNRLLRDDDFDIRFAAYEQLRKLADISISQTIVAGDFFVDNVTAGGQKVIFVSRTNAPRIVLFGAPIYCKDDVFIESSDKNIIINAKPGEKFVSVMRKHPTRPKLMGPMAASFELTDIIRVLCEGLPVKDQPQLRPGLGISYSDLIALLSHMCQSGAINAEFRAGLLSTAGAILEKKPSNDR